ncbi:hypothetical protein BB779_19380 [Pseudomonas viridiflava]|nr:hypothetical protein BB779_19380 [Pseudomonas viridiflava]
MATLERTDATRPVDDSWVTKCMMCLSIRFSCDSGNCEGRGILYSVAANVGLWEALLDAAAWSRKDAYMSLIQRALAVKKSGALFAMALPFLPAVLRNDIRIAPLLFHTERDTEPNRHARRLVPDADNFLLREWRAFFVFYGCKNGYQRRYENKANRIGFHGGLQDFSHPSRVAERS